MPGPTPTPARPHRLRGSTLTLAVVVALAGGPLIGSSVAAADRGAPEEPPPDTIVEVDGDAANGFGIHFHDGTAIFPPTDSEALAECAEYDTLRQRVRCRAEVRTWYRDLADLQQTIAYYRSLLPGRP